MQSRAVLTWIAAVAIAVPAAGQSTQLGPKDGADLPGSDLERVQVGDHAPDFTLEALEGPPVTLSQFRANANVILVFYRGHW